MTELTGWLIGVALVLAVLRLIWPFLIVGIAAYVAIKIGKRLLARHGHRYNPTLWVSSRPLKRTG